MTANRWIGRKKTELDTPCLVLDIDILKANLALMQEHALKNKVAVRPHCKTHKCSKLAQLQMEYGSIGLSVAKISEAEMLIDKGMRNLLITSPLVTMNKINRFIRCVERAPETMVVVDNERNIVDLNEAAQKLGQKINILIDLDPGIGRTGIKFEQALSFANKIQELEFLNLAGIQCYAGNLQHITSYNERKQASLTIMKGAGEVVEALRSSGFSCPILTGTGTGTYDIDIHAPEVTEIQPGSYTVMDVEYAAIGSSTNPGSFGTFGHAMTLLTTVISSNRSEHVTVDAGTKSIYMDLVHKPRIISHQGLHYDWGGFGDEHGKITCDSVVALPNNGEVIELIVPHCDPTINLYDQFFIVERERVIDVWDIDLRGKNQ